MQVFAMRYSIIASRRDLAGMNIAGKLISGFGFRETERKYRGNAVYAPAEKQEGETPVLELVFIDSLQISASHLSELETDFLIFASRHASESKRPSLTVHAPGNWGSECKFGGKPKHLVPTSATLIKNFLVGLQAQAEKKRNQLPSYSVSLEVTHHGPFLKKPAVFIELGSCREQWEDSGGATAIAETIVGSLNAPEPESRKNGLPGPVCAVGIGGGHYAPEFTKLVLRTDYAISHIVPEYALKDFDSEMLGKAISATIEPVKEIVVDWKGLGTEKARIMELLETPETQTLPVRRVRNLLKN